MSNNNDPELAVVMRRSDWVQALGTIGDCEQFGLDFGELGDAIEHAMARQAEATIEED